MIRAFFLLLLVFGAVACSPPDAMNTDNAAAHAVTSGTFTFGPTTTHTVPAIDGREITYYLDVPQHTGDAQGGFPLLVIVDGSGCMGQLREGNTDFYKPGPDSVFPYARLMVEKPGVPATQRYTADNRPTCSEEFLRNYSIDASVTDFQRVLAHLRRRAQWWNGELFLFGWSDGGDIASRLTTYTPGVTRAVLGAMGGGLTMEEHFRDYWECPSDRFEGRDNPETRRIACLDNLENTIMDIYDNPTWTKTWSGDDNSYRVWATRLRARLSNILPDVIAPVVIVQGAEDYYGTPPESARVLVDALEAADIFDATYWEIPDMGHGWNATEDGTFTNGDGIALTNAMLLWLLTGETDVDALQGLEVMPRKL